MHLLADKLGTGTPDRIGIELRIFVFFKAEESAFEKKKKCPSFYQTAEQSFTPVSLSLSLYFFKNVFRRKYYESQIIL